MFPRILRSRCTHKIYFVQHLTRNHLYLAGHVYMKHVQDVFGRNIFVRSRFSCARLYHGLCALMHAHSFGGNIDHDIYLGIFNEPEFRRVIHWWSPAFHWGRSGYKELKWKQKFLESCHCWITSTKFFVVYDIKLEEFFKNVVLMTSFSWPQLMKVGGHSSPSPSDLSIHWECAVCVLITTFAHRSSLMWKCIIIIYRCIFPAVCCCRQQIFTSGCPKHWS